MTQRTPMAADPTGPEPGPEPGWAAPPSSSFGPELGPAPSPTGPEPGSAAPLSSSSGPYEPELVLGLLATPGVAGALTDSLSSGLADELAELLPGARWQVRTDAAADLIGPLALSEVVDWARLRLLERDYDLLVLLTDLPLQIGRRAVLSHASATHSVAVVSLPALGALQVPHRARRAVLSSVRSLVEADGGDDRSAGGRPQGRARHRTRTRVRRLVRKVDRPEAGVAFVAYVLSGNLRLLAGMVRANRPWRLTLHLSRALIAALAAATFALVTSDVWRLADRLGGIRLGLVSVGAIGALMATLIVAAELWERSSVPTARRQVMLFNAATTATVLIGILALYTALFLITLAGAVLFIPSELLAAAVHHPVTLADRASLAWFVSGLATVGGALGAGLETDEAVRDAAYANRRRHRARTDPAVDGGVRGVSDVGGQVQGDYNQQIARKAGAMAAVSDLTRIYAGREIPAPGIWNIDPVHSHIQFVVRHMMIAKVRGRFREFSGILRIAEDPLQSSVDVVVHAASIDTGDADRDQHLRSPDFLDVERYPHITYRSTSVAPGDDGHWLVVGDLTIRDVARPVNLDVELGGVGLDPWGNARTGLVAHTEINREEFGMTWNQALEAGGWLVGKVVTVDIDAEAVRQPDQSTG